ncbi:MAG: hypothetical protein K2H70_00110 [Bacteroidales bacterium]|nr:hypothetical protein [Bacteroidales bacterium]
MENNTRVKIFSCRATRYLAEKIAQEYGCELGKSIVLPFAEKIVYLHSLNRVTLKKVSNP